MSSALQRYWCSTAGSHPKRRSLRQRSSRLAGSQSSTGPPRGSAGRLMPVYKRHEGGTPAAESRWKERGRSADSRRGDRSVLRGARFATVEGRLRCSPTCGIPAPRRTAGGEPSSGFDRACQPSAVSPLLEDSPVELNEAQCIGRRTGDEERRSATRSSGTSRGGAQRSRRRSEGLRERRVTALRASWPRSLWDARPPWSGVHPLFRSGPGFRSRGD